MGFRDLALVSPSDLKVLHRQKVIQRNIQTKKLCARS